MSSQSQSGPRQRAPQGRATPRQTSGAPVDGRGRTPENVNPNAAGALPAPKRTKSGTNMVPSKVKGGRPAGSQNFSTEDDKAFLDIIEEGVERAAEQDYSLLPIGQKGWEDITKLLVERATAQIASEN